MSKKEDKMRPAWCLGREGLGVSLLRILKAGEEDSEEGRDGIGRGRK